MMYSFLVLAAFGVYYLYKIADRITRLVVGASVISTAMVAWLDHPDNPEELKAVAREARAFLGIKSPAEAGLVKKEDA